MVLVKPVRPDLMRTAHPTPVFNARSDNTIHLRDEALVLHVRKDRQQPPSDRQVAAVTQPTVILPSVMNAV